MSIKGIELILKKHKIIYDNFDLGTPFTMVITIQNDTAVITNSNQGVWSDIKSIGEIGKTIAETIFLKGLLVSNLEWGSFTRNQSLLQVDKILKLTDDDIYFEVEYIKLWTIARTISNIKREKDKIYEITYFDEYGSTEYSEKSETEYQEEIEEMEKYFEE